MRRINLQRLRSWSGRKLFRKRVLMLVIGFGVPWLWLLWQFFGPLSAFPISSETTRLTTPLTDDERYVDYLRIVRERWQMPGAKSAKEDTWCLLAGTRENSPNQPKDLPQWIGTQDLLAAWSADHPERRQDAQRYLALGEPSTTAAHALQLSAEKDSSVRRFLELLALPITLQPHEDPIKMIDEGQRFVALDNVQLMHSDPLGGSNIASNYPERLKPMVANYAAHRVDFGQLLKFQDTLIDKVCEALKSPTYREQVEKMNAALAHPLAKISQASGDLNKSVLDGEFDRPVKT